MVEVLNKLGDRSNDLKVYIYIKIRLLNSWKIESWNMLRMSKTCYLKMLNLRNNYIIVLKISDL